MSATDSDNSIDWLVSDNEDNESKPDCSRKPGEAGTPPSPSGAAHLGPSDSSCCRSSEVNESDSDSSKVREASSQGSPPSCKESRDRDSTNGLYNRKNTRQAMKRRHSSTEDECKQWQFITNMSEKDQFFSSKVRTSVTRVFSMGVGGVGGQHKQSVLYHLYLVLQYIMHDISSQDDPPLKRHKQN